MYCVCESTQCMHLLMCIICTLDAVTDGDVVTMEGDVAEDVDGDGTTDVDQLADVEV